MSSISKNAVLPEKRSVENNKSNKQFLYPSYLLENQLMDAVSDGDLNGALSIIESLSTSERPKYAFQPLRSAKNQLISICTLYTRAILRGGASQEVASSLNMTYMLEIENCQTEQELSELEYDMLVRFIEGLNKSRATQYSNIINEAIGYIQSHILEDLSLQAISTHCNVNPSYLSHLFKKEVGVSTVQFINQKKIEEAKYFLLHTNQSIADLAKKFNFCNQSYFTAQFKFYTSMTPKQFRDSRAI
ncbi:AraC family transcriptional regulator [Terribacillus saccharophilus]|uniref:Helix-turn-helix domain-containing protein n=1 Tax=Terribacillus saccharophilus TaxID=361277 RepID=A0A075LTS6_9BACI|nr:MULTISPECIES: AraC family transcriptional regulator [Terribacillus]AIF67823.1 hypothetical protein GZ22_15045 [Terribacillus goriensis]MCM3225380.1 AraC family transcriptional regulator [Terribacillus saccharophilus]MEC0281907.1 AraC family transcriptional regulator [Terribacillus saccharophilus]MEC0291304.1 AraC family transcriptional regulator [Terribacillus saccharophilus]MEC0301816.1 AraC family transcriptional regulator [Terribacillus saccharophilus]